MRTGPNWLSSETWPGQTETSLPPLLEAFRELSWESGGHLVGFAVLYSVIVLRILRPRFGKDCTLPGAQ